MIDETTFLQLRAALCFRLAEQCGEKDISAQLRLLAADLQERVVFLEQLADQAGAPKGHEMFKHPPAER